MKHLPPDQFQFLWNVLSTTWIHNPDRRITAALLDFNVWSLHNFVASGTGPLGSPLLIPVPRVDPSLLSRVSSPHSPIFLSQANVLVMSNVAPESER